MEVFTHYDKYAATVFSGSVHSLLKIRCHCFQWKCSFITKNMLPLFSVEVRVCNMGLPKPENPRSSDFLQTQNPDSNDLPDPVFRVWFFPLFIVLSFHYLCQLMSKFIKTRPQPSLRRPFLKRPSSRINRFIAPKAVNEYSSGVVEHGSTNHNQSSKVLTRMLA